MRSSWGCSRLCSPQFFSSYLLGFFLVHTITNPVKKKKQSLAHREREREREGELGEREVEMDLRKLSAGLRETMGGKENTIERNGKEN
jgi:hypothetical protein